MAPARGCGAGKRFSEEERLSFGKWTFLAAGPRCFGEPLASGALAPQAQTLVRCKTAPALPAGGQRPRWRTSPGAVAGGSRPSSALGSCAGSPPGGRAEVAKVRSVLECILPASSRELASPRTPVVARSPTGENAPESFEALAAAAGSPFSVAGFVDEGRGVCPKYQGEVMERFRKGLMQRFLSLHDAFARLDHTVARDRALDSKEFRTALARLGVGEEDADALFAAMDRNSDGGVTLAEFLHVLVDVSTEGLLWELRCRLIRFGICPQNLWKALELVQWPQHGWLSRATKVKRQTTRKQRKCDACFRPGDKNAAGRCGDCSMRTSSAHWPPVAAANASEACDGSAAGASLEIRGALGEDVATQRRPSSFHLNRGDWLKLCTSIYMTLFEAERLFDHLADARGFVDLRAMFEVLRTTVEPDVTLERFTTKLTARFGSAAACFEAFRGEDRTTDPEPLMRWPSFHKLCVALNVNNGNAERLWGFLMESLEATTAGRSLEARTPEALAAAESPRITIIATGDESGRDDGRGVTLDSFVRELAIWSPETPLEQLKGQLCDRFGNLSEGKRALQQRLTTPPGQPLPLKELDGKLRQVGIKNCDVARALTTVADQHGDVSLEATIGAMRTIRQKGAKASDVAKGAHTAVRNETQPLWERLRAVQHDCRRGFRGGSLRASPTGRRRRTRSNVANGCVGQGCSPKPLVDSKAAAAAPAEPLPATPKRLVTTAGGGSLGASPVLALDRQKFSEAIHGAVRYAETNRSQSILHNAHRQVLRLEQRWASPNKWPCGMHKTGSVPNLRANPMASTA